MSEKMELIQPMALNEIEKSDESEISSVPKLAELHDDALVSEAELALMFGRHVTSIKRSVQKGQLPPPFKLLGSKRWTARTLREHFHKLEDAAQKRAVEIEKKMAALYVTRQSHGNFGGGK